MHPRRDPYQRHPVSRIPWVAVLNARRAACAGVPGARFTAAWPGGATSQ